MNHTNSQVNITLGAKTYSINYAYNKSTTFYDLLEYFAYLYPELNLCQCYEFYILQKRNKYNLISASKISEREDYLNNLSLIKTRKDCIHKKENYFLLSKTNLISIFKIKNDDLKNIIQELNNKHSKAEKEHSQKIAELNSQIKELEYDNELLLTSVNGVPSKTEFLKQMGFNNINKLKECPNLIEINKQNGQIEVKNQKNDNVNSIDFYDVIVHIDSIKDINKGWKIEMNERGKRNYTNYKGEKLLKIGVIGNANKGKSFLLSRISKMTNIPSGTSIKTEGLSIKYPELEIHKDRRIALLDSAGLETPVLVNKGAAEDEKNNNELFKEKCREKLITELFLQNYIVNISDILIVVVDSLSFSEQKLLMKIKKEMKRAKRTLPLYIIHNLKTFTAVNQVEDYINNTLLKSATFTLAELIPIHTDLKSLTGIGFFEVNKDKNEPDIFHLIYANENSEAGKYYNQYTLNYIEHIYQGLTNYKPLDIIESIKDRFVDLYEEIIEKNENNEKITKKSFNASNTDFIKLNNKKEIVLKQCLIDEVGFSNLKPNGFEPKYNLYNIDNKIIIKVECPGNGSIRAEMEPIGEYYMIRLSGEKYEDEDSAKFVDNNISYNKREFGKFKFEIPLNSHKYKLSYEKPSIRKEKGMFILEYKLFQEIIFEEFKD